MKELQLSLLNEKTKKINIFLSYKERKKYKDITEQKKISLLDETSSLKNMINHSISFIMYYIKENNKTLNIINSNMNDFRTFIDESKKTTIEPLKKGLYSKGIDYLIEILDNDFNSINLVNDFYSNRVDMTKDTIYLDYNLKNESNESGGFIFDNFSLIKEIQSIYENADNLIGHFDSNNYITYDLFIKLTNNKYDLSSNQLSKRIILKEINKTVLNMVNEEVEMLENVSQDLYELLLEENKLEKIIISFYELAHNNYYFYKKNIFSLKKKIKELLIEQNKENRTAIISYYNEKDELVFSAVDKLLQFNVDLFKVDLKNKEISVLHGDFYSHKRCHNTSIMSDIRCLESLFRKLLPSFDIKRDNEIKIYSLKDNERCDFINITN